METVGKSWQNVVLVAAHGLAGDCGKPAAPHALIARLEPVQGTSRELLNSRFLQHYACLEPPMNWGNAQLRKRC